MQLTWQKWFVVGALAVISIILGLLPLLLFRKGTKLVSSISRKSLARECVLSALSCFGGGVLLATCLCHMLTEARDDLASVNSIWEHLPEELPLSEVLTLAGFILIYAIEEFAHVVINDSHHHHHSHHHHRKGSTQSNAGIVQSQIFGGVPEDLEAEASSRSLNEGDQAEEKLRPGSIVRSVVAVIALSFHAIMEGVAIGVQESAGVWFMFGAVASHKFVISFCMGMELFAARTKHLTAIFSIVFFGVISSVGILIGSVISGSDTNTLPIAIIKGVSTGTLLYVVFFEVLDREREKRIHGPFRGSSSKYVGFLQCLSVTIGIVVMVLLFQLDGHNHPHHDHDHDHDHEVTHGGLVKVLATTASLHTAL